MPAKAKMKKKYGEWVVLGESDERPASGQVQYNCRCSCGTERVVSGSALRSSRTNSCGCKKAELSLLSRTLPKKKEAVRQLLRVIPESEEASIYRRFV